jgi:hypothetical protein
MARPPATHHPHRRRLVCCESHSSIRISASVRDARASCPIRCATYHTSHLLTSLCFDSMSFVCHVHPSGGAERLIVDAASALQQSGTASVHIFTNYHDPNHCYAETRDGTIPVTVYGRTSDAVFGRFRVLIAILRMIYLTIIFACRHSTEFDVVVVEFHTPSQY